MTTADASYNGVGCTGTSVGTSAFGKLVAPGSDVGLPQVPSPESTTWLAPCAGDPVTKALEFLIVADSEALPGRLRSVSGRGCKVFTGLSVGSVSGVGCP